MKRLYVMPPPAAAISAASSRLPPSKRRRLSAIRRMVLDTLASMQAAQALVSIARFPRHEARTTTIRSRRDVSGARPSAVPALSEAEMLMHQCMARTFPHLPSLRQPNVSQAASGNR